MAIERETIVRRAERLLQQGRLDDALDEYQRLVDAQPRDWNARNALGDLYARRGDTARAAAQFLKVAQHLEREGFLPRAAALYKKVLKVDPASEPALEALGAVAAGQGLLADAKAYVRRLAALRRDRQDRSGVEDCVLRLADIDPSDAEAVDAAVTVAARRGEPARAVAWLAALAEAREAAGLADEALDARARAAALAPGDASLRARMVEACVAAGDFDRAAPLLDLASCGDEPELLLRFARRELHGRAESGAAVAALTRVLALDPGRLEPVAAMAAEVAARAGAEHGFRCLDVVVDAAILDGRLERATELLEAFLAVTPHPPAVARLDALRREAAGDAAPSWNAAAADAPPEESEPPDVTPPGDADEEVPVDLQVPDAPVAGRGLLINAEDVDLSVVLGELDQARPAAPPAEPEPPSGSSSDSSSDATPEAPPSLTSIFAGLRDRTADRQAPPTEGSAPVYEQGVAALEAGDVAAGLEALRTAARDPRQRFVAASRLAWSFVQQGDHEAAIEWFERAAEAPAPRAADNHAVLYALAEALERSGEPARALAVLLELEADTDGYRDVRVRIGELRARVDGGSR